MNTRFGLTEATIQKISTVLENHPRVTSAVIYGSRAKGNYKTGSDIDLTLRGDALEFDDLTKIADELDDLLLAYTIDLSIFDMLEHAKLREHIERVGKVLYQREKTTQPSNWKSISLSDVFKVGSSKRVLQADWKKEGVPFYRGREITRLASDGFVDNELFISEELYTELAAKYAVPSSGDIVITAIGTIGNSYIVREQDKFYFKDASVLWLKKISDVSSEFINYWLKSPLFFNQLEKGNGATVDTLTIQKLQSLLVVLPPLPEQQRIVAILDEAFAGIATAAAHAEKNLSNARALFDSAVQTIFTNKGERWKEKTLKEVCAKITDGTHQTPKYFESGFIFLSSKNVTSGKIDWENVKYIDEKQHLEMQKRITPKVGDILLAKNGTTGVAAMVDRDAIFDIYVSLAHIRVLNEVSASFMLYFINSPFAKRQFNKRLKGSGVPNLHLEEIREVVIPFPESTREQDLIVQALDELSAETQKLEALYQQKLNALAELKKSVLHQAFTGKLV